MDNIGCGFVRRDVPSGIRTGRSQAVHTIIRQQGNRGHYKRNETDCGHVH